MNLELKHQEEETETTNGPSVTKIRKKDPDSFHPQPSTTLIRKKLANEREDVQKKTFTKWVNSQLSKGSHQPVTDLFYDLRDGTKLMALLEVLTGHKIKSEKGQMRVHHLNNVDRALKYLEEQNVKLINIANDNIVDGSAKITLGLVWAIILHWQVQGVLREVMADLQQTNLEKTLLAWCRQTTQGYQGVDIRNFTSSWRDGLAFCAILHHHRPDLFEWPVMAKKHPYARLDNAFRIAYDHLNIERLLDPEDVNTQNPDKKSVMMYVMCLFQVLPHSSFSVENLDVSVQSDSSFSTEANDSSQGQSISSISACLLNYQHTLEDVLTWLLGAEDRLAGMPPIADNTKDVKEQFHELEDLMLDLTSKQGGIGDVLGEGSRLLRDNALEGEESEEVKLQMKLLNTRWEDLRVRAMDRQTKLHEKLMKLQQDELEVLKHWLTKTEDRIANMSQLGPTFQDLETQLSSHQELQKDLEAEQENINSLSNMVVVVDENCSDTASSSLEDELNALGERWAHICKWAEQRWLSLQTLQLHWGELDKEMVKFGEWLDDKERILKEMESNPTSDHQEMLQQASALRMLQSEMDVHLDRFNVLQDKANILMANLPKESTANEVVPLELESMQDRWDILTSIVDAHSQRITASGIDIRAIKVTGNVSSDFTTSTTTLKDERGLTVTKITTTSKTVSSDKMEGGSPKRQKMSSKVHEDFTAAFLIFSGWMEGIEAQIEPSITKKLPTDQIQTLCQHIEDEMKNNKEEYNTVLNLGHAATSETSTIAESTTVENEVKLTSIKTRWTSMQKTLNNLRTRIKFNQEFEKNQPKLIKIKSSCKELEEWINEMQSTISIDIKLASQQLQECQEKKLRIQEKENELIEMEKVAHNLSSLFAEEKDDFLRNVQAAIFETKNINMRICNWELILKDTARSPTNLYPESGLNFFASEPMDLVVTPEQNLQNSNLRQEFEDLTLWINETEQNLSSAYISQVLHKLQDGLRKFKALMEAVDMKQDKLTHINEASQKGNLLSTTKVKELNLKWNQVIENLANRISEIERGIERLHQFDEETSGMRSWLDEVEAFLEAEDAAVGDVETLQAQLEQSTALQDDIITLQDNMSSITETGRYFQETGDEELRDSVTSLLREIIERWEKATSKAKKQNLELEQAHKRSQKVWDDCKELDSWIQETELRTPKSFSIETTAELNSICELFDDLKKKLESKIPNYKALQDFGIEIFGSEKVQPSSELKEAIEQLNDRWLLLVSEIDFKVNLVNNSRENYAKFKKLSSEEEKWLDDLESKIEKSSKESTDAEEISEALDDLDSFLHGHDANILDEIQKFADELIKAGLMTVAVQNISHNLTTRYESLTSKAQDQQLRLEGGVLEAQDLEREYVKVLEHLSSGQSLLYQFPDHDQLAQLEADHVSHREVLQTMEQKVEEYKNQGKLHAAQRLRDQFSHLMKQYDEFDEKFRLCQQAVDFDSRLLTLSQLLSDTDQEARNFNIESVEQEHLEKQLNKCLVLYRSLSDVKSDVESLIATGRKLVKENMCSDPDTLTIQLDQLKALYNQLGGCVTEQRGRLESALKQSKKLEKDSAQLEEWLSHIERELDLRETTISVQNIHHEIEFAQNALDDVSRKKPVMSGLQESLAILSSLCGERLTKPLRDQISDLTMSWERVQTRLSNRVTNMKKQDDSKEEEMERFILKVGEIKAWLKKTEDQISSIDSFPAEQRDNTLQTLSNEVSQYKEEINGTRKLSEDLIARGTLYESRLLPELISLTRRWENISSSIKIKDTDSSKRELYDRRSSNSVASIDFSQSQYAKTLFENEETLPTRPCLKATICAKDSMLHAKKRFGKVYKSDEMTLLTDIPGDKNDHTDYRISGDLRWSSSSSSAQFSPSEEGSSVDFGSESRGESWSGDLESFFLNRNERDNAKRDSSLSFVASDNLRYSLASFSSFDTNKDDVFFESLNDDLRFSTKIESAQESSSSDESDAGNTSQVRISATTEYELAVLKELEDGKVENENRVSGRIKSLDFENDFYLTEPLPNNLLQESRPVRTSLYDNVPESDESITCLISDGEQKLIDISTILDTDLETNESCDTSIDDAAIEEKNNKNEAVDSKVAPKETSITSFHSLEEKPLSPVPFLLHLERHLSMDSSVSTLSEAETVIHVPDAVSPKSVDSPVKKVSSFNEERNSKEIKLARDSLRSVSSETINLKSLDSTEKLNRASKSDQEESVASELECQSDYKTPICSLLKDTLNDRENVNKKFRSRIKRSRSSESSESTEEQEISLDISDSTLSDSMGRNADSKKIKSRKSAEKQAKVEHLSTRKEECFVIGNRYAMLHDRKKVDQLNKDGTKRKMEKFSKPMDKFEPNERMVESAIFGSSRSRDPYYVIDQSSSRFSTGSYCTDVSESEQLLFSETEEDLPYDDTTDDDLNLEDEVLKALAEREGSAKTSEDFKQDVIEAYFQEVSAIVDRIASLRKHELTPNKDESFVALMGFEEGVCRLEPDVATLISRGDTLTLKTHIVDVPKADSIRIAVNDLRRCWTDLKDRAETVKNESECVQRESKEAPNKAMLLIASLDDVSKRITSANNCDEQLKSLEIEISDKKSEVEKMNAVGQLLKKYNYTQLESQLTIINSRWAEINTNLSQYLKNGSSYKSIGSSTSDLEDDLAIVPDFLANVNRLRESISSISRKLNSKILSGKDYDNLVGKDEELRVIKKEVDRLKPKVDSVETERLSTIKKANQNQMEQVRRVIDKLREEWAQVNRCYTEKHAWWLHNSEQWRTLHRTIEDFSLWLNSAEEKLNLTSNQTIPEAKTTQKELEKQVTLKHRPSQTLQTLSKEVTEELNSEDRHRLQERVDSLLKRWRSLLLDLAARRERIAQGEASKEGTNLEFESVVTWVDSAHDLMDTPVNVTDEAALSAHTTIVKNQLNEMENHANKLKNLKSANFSGSESIQFSTIEGCFNRVRETFPEYKSKLETKLKVIQSLVVDVDVLYKWTEEMRVRIALRNMTADEIRSNKNTLKEKNVIYENLDNTYWALAQDAENKNLAVSEELKSRMNSIETRLKNLESQFSTEDLMTTLGAQIGGEKTAVSAITTTAPLVTSAAAASPRVSDRKVTSGTTVATSVSDVIQNVVKFEETVYTHETPVAAPFPKSLDGSSPALILAALDKSILQIRDWLTLMEQMSRQQVAIMGDETDIRRLIEKQKSVLRELEGKKPQLDDLVSSADGLKDDGSRTQLQQQVTKLREHWDETNSAVLARKTQLDAMLNDTHKFESKRIELETWLSRMEAKLDRMAPVSRITDQLEQQIREQKSFHSEVNQYKYQFDLFTQMTSRLITVYQNDDTRRLKKASDSLNLRFSNLNSNIMTRGKNLYSSMNSAHSMSKALEKFISWLSDSESNVSVIELEVDKMPSSSGTGRRDTSNPRSPYARLKDLQSEIESHKDVLASLNATGQKLLGTLENQDDAVLLHRRLDEMNHRWNTLKYKSIAIRNRLEGTAENWNSLLLSLRELIEWVIRKDTELTGLGPLIGDVHILAKYEEDLTSFRRLLDEKQPVIESNLKSGRQLIASEPPLSDTSDSEAGRDVEGDARYRGEENTRELVRSVRREVSKLSEKWATLWERAANMAAQVSLAHKKLGVLQKTLEDVCSRLEESEKVVATWGPIPLDSNLADQHVHNVRKFRENTADLQRGVDDVNDQAARFSAHNIPLTPQNCAALHDLNNRWKNLETTVNDRWRQVAGRSREVTPLTPAQLASSVNPPWERATATNKVPYYINHSQETTHWDHPIMMDLLDSLADFNHIKFSAYRTASKLRSLQKKLSLDRAKLQLVTDVFDEHGLRGQNDRLIDVNDMIVVLSTLYGRISSDHVDVNTTIATDLCLNWLLNVYDSQRTGQMRVLSFRIGLICLCRGHLEEKYRYMFRLIADPNRLVDQRKLGLLLHDCVQVPRQLGEVAAFGGSNIEPSVRSCFTKAGKDRETIEAVHFLTWVQQEPQSLVWLAVLHRVAASETVQHQVKCNICKTYPITGLRYRCLKCLSFDMCQRCFFDGRSSKSHKITHPMHEYCTATTAGDEMKDFTKALKNKFKSKRSLQKHTKKGYLPVQTVLEGDPLESPSPSPSHNVSSQDMHSRLELYASRLAEVELRTNSNSTPDSEDEHGLIAQYCQSLSSSDAPFPVPKSPLQIMASVDADQKDELEQMIRDLEEENQALQAEYERLKSQQPTGSALDDGMGQRSETEMLAEAKLLREHKGRLEARMSILEDHNRQLEAQLQRLRQLLVEQQGGMGSPNKSGTLQTKSVTASQLAMDSPAKINGHSSQGDLEKAVGNLVDSMNPERANDSHSDDNSDENDYDNTGINQASSIN